MKSKLRLLFIEMPVFIFMCIMLTLYLILSSACVALYFLLAIVVGALCKGCGYDAGDSLDRLADIKQSIDKLLMGFLEYK